PGTSTTAPTAPGTVTPAAITKQLVLDRLALRMHGTKLLLSWRASAGSKPARYLVVWHTRRTAHGRLITHRARTAATTLRLPAGTPHSLKVTLSAYAAGGKLLRTVTKTVKLSK